MTVRAAVVRALASALALLLAGCAGLPDVTQRAPQTVLPPPLQSPLQRIVANSLSDPQVSGLRLLASGADSLQVRLELIERAQSSIDLQVYRFKGDVSGRIVMRALRAAAGRGVRVRVLVDDFYTSNADLLLLLGLSSHDNVQVRLFNPFNHGRDNALLRVTVALFGSERLHRRMHNKLMVVDGVTAVAGGRNIGDEYFDAGTEPGFYDFDVLVAGFVVPQLARSFDPYWNSRYSHDVHEVLGEPPPGESLRSNFDAHMQADCPAGRCSEARPAIDPGNPLQREFATSRIAMHEGYAVAAADLPDVKLESDPNDDLNQPAPPGAEVRSRLAQVIRSAREELVLVSPYLIPGPSGVQALRSFRERGVHVTLMTNSLATTDEPLAHLGYRRYRVDLLREGVEVYEWSLTRSGRVFRQLLRGNTVLRLHTKCALIDRRFAYIGSMNFDPRSRNLNTETGLLIQSPELVHEIHTAIEAMKREGSYRLQLAADGQTIRWLGGDGQGGVDTAVDEPDTDFWSRFLLDLMSPFVPEDLL